MTSNFVHVSTQHWLFRNGIDPERKQRLQHGIAFKEIIRQIGNSFVIRSHKRAELRKCPGYFRIEITLVTNALLVDLFHNSAAGYRAQYYHDVRTGKAANEYAVRQLAPGIMKLLDDHPKHSCPLGWVKQSLYHPEAKLWIHQGSWLRLGKR